VHEMCKFEPWGCCFCCEKVCVHTVDTVVTSKSDLGPWRNGGGIPLCVQTFGSCFYVGGELTLMIDLYYGVMYVY